MRGAFFAARCLFFRRRGRKQGGPLWGASLGIALAMIPLVTVDHLADGMIKGIIDRYRETSTYHLQIHAWGPRDRDVWEERIQELKGYPQVLGAWTERQGFGLARGENLREGLTLRALPAAIADEDPRFSSLLNFDQGSWDLDSPDSLLLGREAARRLGVSAGQELQVLTGKSLPDGGYVPKVTRFRVKGIFSTGYQDIDRLWAFIPLDTGWEILPAESSRTFLGVKTRDPDKDAPALQEDLASRLPPRWAAYDWQALNRSRLRNFASTRASLLFIMALLVVVAVMSISSSLIMLTLERRREIGILKCAGTAPREVALTFLIAGIFAALAGIIGGIALGFIISTWINEIIWGLEQVTSFVREIFVPGSPPQKLLDEAYYLQEIPVSLRWGSAGIIGALSLVLALAAGWLPAHRAAKIRPLDVLRKH